MNDSLNAAMQHGSKINIGKGAAHFIWKENDYI